MPFYEAYQPDLPTRTSLAATVAPNMDHVGVYYRDVNGAILEIRRDFASTGKDKWKGPTLLANPDSTKPFKPNTPLDEFEYGEGNYHGVYFLSTSNGLGMCTHHESGPARRDDFSNRGLQAHPESDIAVNWFKGYVILVSQDSTGRIAISNENAKNANTTLDGPKPLPGTRIAMVPAGDDESTLGQRVFFQDEDGSICESLYDTKKDAWSTPQAIDINKNAASADDSDKYQLDIDHTTFRTPLAATSYKRHRAMHTSLFYLDKDKNLVEIVWDAKAKNWSTPKTVETANVLQAGTDLAAASRVDGAALEVYVYYAATANVILEQVKQDEDGKWSPTVLQKDYDERRLPTMVKAYALYVDSNTL